MPRGVAISRIANFSGLDPVTDGHVTTFTVVVPQPGALALATLGIGLAGWAIVRRRRVA